MSNTKQTKIEAIDTNVLLRLILRDNEVQYFKASALIEDRQGQIEYYLNPSAIIEAVFVMERQYLIPRGNIVALLKPTINYFRIRTSKETINEAFELYLKHPKLSYTDCYLACVSEKMDAIPLWTFDKKLSLQTEVTELLS